MLELVPATSVSPSVCGVVFGVSLIAKWDLLYLKVTQSLPPRRPTADRASFSVGCVFLLGEGAWLEGLLLWRAGDYLLQLEWVETDGREEGWEAALGQPTIQTLFVTDRLLVPYKPGLAEGGVTDQLSLFTEDWSGSWE